MTVSDTGPGIDKGDMEKVFDPFDQAGDLLSRKQEGAGLGLSIVHAVVDLRGGSLSVESRVGQGTAVHFTLPAERCVSFQADYAALFKARGFNPKIGIRERSTLLLRV